MLDICVIQTEFKSCLVQDHNRYSATKGAHLNLKRAEKARITVTKLPGNAYNCQIFSVLM